MTPQEKREAEVHAEYGVGGIAYDGPENGERMNKHTPGPWRAGGSNPYGWDIRTDEDDDVWLATVMNNHTGEDQRPSSGFPSNVEGLANTHLIAAAPDLLEAAKMVASNIGYVTDGNGDVAAWDALEAAIAKAENGEPNA